MMKGKRKIVLTVAALIFAIGFGCVSAACKEIASRPNPSDTGWTAETVYGV